MICVDTYTLPDLLQGCVPRFPPLTTPQRGRLLELSQMHPERRFVFLGPTDKDFTVLNWYLTLNPTRLRRFLLVGSPCDDFDQPTDNNFDQPTGC